MWTRASSNQCPTTRAPTATNMRIGDSLRLIGNVGFEDLEHVARDGSHATVLATHDRADAFSLADRVIVMRDGRIVQSGRPEDLFENPVDPFIAAVTGAELSFRVDGPLIELPINEGDEVVAGQLLARIDPRDYEIALAEAKAAFEKGEADLKRYQRLYEQEAIDGLVRSLKKLQLIESSKHDVVVSERGP